MHSWAAQLVDALNLHAVRDRHWYFISCSATKDSSKVRWMVCVEYLWCVNGGASYHDGWVVW